MREVLGLFFLGLLALSSCVEQGGHQPTYIISEKSSEQAPSYEVEEAR